MLVNIKYKKFENQGFFNETERELSRIPLRDEIIEIDNELYYINYICTNVDNDRIILRCYPFVNKGISINNYNWIAISCSIKKYYPEAVINIIKGIILPSLPDNPVKIINGFFFSVECNRRNLDTKWSKYLEQNFCLINFYDILEHKVCREEMVECAKENNAIVYIIGEIEDGVKEEFELYQKAGLETRIIPLEPNDLPF
jgi:hypothetical protein